MVYLDKNDKKPLFEQLYETIKQDILSGRLAKDTALGSLRTMEKDLNVSRNTVDRAYQQLTMEGYIRSVQGAGYFVEDIGETELFSEASFTKPDEPEAAAAKRRPKPRYDFEFNNIDSRLFPWAKWAKYVQNAIWKESYETVLSYEGNKGNYRLRQSLCGYLYRHRGVKASPEQMILCAGTQYAMDILANILPPNENALAYEDPGYDAMRHLLAEKGYRITPVPVLEKGIDIRRLRESGCNLLYLTPSHQFPTGIVTPIYIRSQIIRWARQENIYIIENDYDSEFRYGLMPIPSIQSLDGGRSVIYLGTLSKVLSPSIRCAFLILPDSLIKIYEKKYHYFNAALPSYHQTALADFIDDGLLEKHLRKITTINEKKYYSLIRAIKDFLAGEVEIYQPPAGVHTLVRIPKCTNQEELINEMYQASIGIYGTKTHSYDQRNIREDVFLMGFNAMSEEDIREGCKRMASVLRKTGSHPTVTLKTEQLSLSTTGIFLDNACDKEVFSMSKEEIFAKLKSSIIDMDEDLAVSAAKEAMTEGIDPLECISGGLSAGMQVLSDQFDEGEVFVPQLLISSEVFEAAVKILTSKMTEEEKSNASSGTVVIHTVQGDIHDIGKNIVKTIFEANNFVVHDLGRDVPVETVVEKAKEVKADFILGSALMTTSMPAQRDIINLLKEEGIRDQFIVMFGGAPVNQEWCDKIGADGYSPTATDAVVVAKRLLKQKRGG
jgi:GntR family transcriptional regulator/MocR family aminotransferase